MIRRGRPGITETQKADIWRRWKLGHSVREICQALKRSPTTVRLRLRQSGGFRPRIRRRSALALTLAEREEISRGLCCGSSLRAIPKRLGRAPSTVSREVARHSGHRGYRANHAEYEASLSALRPKLCRLARNGKLRKLVASKLALERSPEQISGWLTSMRSERRPARRRNRISSLRASAIVGSSNGARGCGGE